MSAEAIRNARIAAAIRRRNYDRQGVAPVDSARQLNANLRNALPPRMVPGNIGDINRVIWPFFFPFNAPELTPNTSTIASVTVTQEAAFIWMSWSKAVFQKTTGPTQYTYIDPQNFNSDLGGVNGLTTALRDASSTRVFNGSPTEIDTMGDANQPSVLPTPIMFLPNATIELNFTNNHPTNTYVPFVTMFGYRVRIQDAQKILSMITG